MTADSGGEKRSCRGRGLLRLVSILALMAVIAAEAYYIYELRTKIEEKEDELKNISMQLQVLKTERTTLHDELADVKKTTGGKSDGDTAER